MAAVAQPLARDIIPLADAPAAPAHRLAGCEELLNRFHAEAPRPLATGKIRFEGVGDSDVYNITAPFSFDRRTLIAGRVESRASEHAVTMLFCRDSDGVWRPCPGAPVFEGLQDPCVALVGGELVIGGVRYPVPLPNGRNTWRMEFYRGRTLDALMPFLAGPNGMKDIRFAELADGRVAVLTRPQGRRGGRGKIGLAVARDLGAVTTDLIAKAPLLADQVPGKEWVGGNELHLLSDGRLGVLGHVACYDRRRCRHYYPMVFAVDPDTRECSELRLIGTRALFPEGPAKRPDLEDVVFSGGLLRHWDGTATLFAGLSDTEAAYLQMPDPLSALERA